MAKSRRNKAKSPKPESKPRRSDAFGKNLLGVSYIAPDFYEDIPLEFLLGEDGPDQTCGDDGGSGDGG